MYTFLGQNTNGRFDANVLTIDAFKNPEKVTSTNTAAVASDLTPAPTKTPCAQSNDSKTNGTPEK
uniref:Uncharacterized protein n=1 Tax=Romanomermis culicivorax TaxID=13658 RepID=A0A915I8S8_ROMCU